MTTLNLPCGQDLNHLRIQLSDGLNLTALIDHLATCESGLCLDKGMPIDGRRLSEKSWSVPLFPTAVHRAAAASCCNLLHTAQMHRLDSPVIRFGRLHHLRLRHGRPCGGAALCRIQSERIEEPRSTFPAGHIEAPAHGFSGQVCPRGPSAWTAVRSVSWWPDQRGRSSPCSAATITILPPRGAAVSHPQSVRPEKESEGAHVSVLGL